MSYHDTDSSLVELAGKLLQVVLAVALVLGLMFAYSMLVALPVMWLWNYLAPTFGWPVLGWFQTWALAMLLGLLVKPPVVNYKSSDSTRQ